MKPSSENPSGKEKSSAKTHSEQKVIIQKERCKGCALCVVYCPRGRIKMSDELNNYGSLYAIFSDLKEGEDKNSECNSCGFCYLVCPEVAIEVRKK